MPQQPQGELVLAQNQYAYIQDATKGSVQVYVGPFKTGLTANDYPVAYRTGKFVQVPLEEAIRQNESAPEGSYVILENPAADGKNPAVGGNSPISLQTGRKVNIPGPVAFALWPGQVATVLEGHQLRSNEYVIVRIYNALEAKNRWEAVANATDTKADDVDTGSLLIIKGTENSFFIPPDGFEVLKEQTTQKYVRKALTLERLEYCILLDEDGNKRYERGPEVVFPKATETFVEKAQESGGKTTKFKAVELNDQMGLYIKVIADYEEGGKKYVTGDELFITGKQQRIYYPRPEHALIEYGSDDTSFRRQRYYGIAIPSGEARYVLDKNDGRVSRKLGPMVYLPDPRNEIIVRRVLDARTVDLWYPGNSEAQAYNAALRPLMESSQNYVADTKYAAAVDMQTRSLNRLTKGSPTVTASAMYATPTIPSGETMNRGTQFTPPPSITLNTKYEGVPTVNVWTGYAVQVVNKQGQRRLIKGPATILLEYDETFEVMTLSSGKPKSMDNAKRTVYLRTDHNKVSDIISVETKDMVTVNVGVSYRVNFEGDSNKWFAVENYVKFLTDHMRSLLRASVKGKTVKEFIDNSASIVRDTVLGPHKEVKGEKGSREGRTFDENGMRVYDVEVLSTTIPDNSIATMLANAQKATVTQTLQLASKESELELTKRRTVIETEITRLITTQELDALNQQVVINRERALVEEAKVLSDLDLTAKQLTGQKAHDAIRLETKAAQLAFRTTADTHDMEVMKQEADLFIKKFAVIDPKLVEAIHALSQNGMLTSLAEAIAPLAVMEQQGVGTVLEKLFHGTGFLNRLNGSVLKDKVEQSK
jgi:major vault protein